MMEESPSPKLNNNDYDSDYPAFDSSQNSLMINFESKNVVTSNNKHHNTTKKQNKSVNNQFETKVVKFPAKNVPKNSEKFLSDLKNKVSHLKSQIIATKLPCGGFNILVKASRDKIQETVTIVERELEPKIIKKIKLDPCRFTILTAKNFEIAYQVLHELSKNIHVSSQQSNTLVLTGISSDVSLAVQLINKYVEKISTNEKLIIEDIAQKYHPFIRGAFNSNISRIISECDNCVVIDIPLPSVVNRAITIIGPSEYRIKAKQEIMKIYDSIKKKLIVKTFKISVSLHSNIKRACGIDKILKETNVAISLPFENQKSDSVIFVGSSQDIPNAFQLALARARVYKYHEISCKPWVFKILKQTPKFSFNEIKTQYPDVWVSYLAYKECIVLDGPGPHVNQIDDLYTNEINQINKNMTYTSTKIPFTFVSHLKGSGAYIVDKISHATETKIDIGDILSSNIMNEKPIESQVVIVCIFGKENNISEALNLFEEYIEQLNESFSVEIEFDSLYTNYIISKCVTNSIHEELKQNFGNNIRVNIRNSKNKRVSYIVLQGQKGTILGAQSFVEDLIKTVSNQILIYDVSIPIAYHHLLIGKKGAIKDEIVENSGIEKIIFPSNNSDDYTNTNTNVITIVGSEKACKLAEIIMMEKCNMDVKLDQIDLQLPKALVEKLKMANGIILRRIIMSCHTNSVLVEDSIKPNFVNVYLPNGELQALNKVRIHGYQEYTKILAEKFKNYSKGSGLIVESLNVDDNMIKAIIGKGGAQLKKFSKDSSVEIIIPKVKSQDNIFLMGTNQNDVNKLRSHILSFVKELKDTIEVSIDIPKKYYRKLLLKKNNQESLITQWNNQYSTLKITVPKEEDVEKQFKLKGPSKIVNNLKIEIQKLVKKWDDTVRVEFSIPYDHAQLLRNTEEPNFNSISQKFDVIIRSFRDGDKTAKPSNDTEVKVVIEGITKSVENAQQFIMESGPISEYFTAPRQYHRSLIGTKGSELKKIVDGMNVSLTFPDNSKNNDQILVRGPKKQVNVVLKRLHTSLEALIKKQKEWELNNYMTELTIDSKWLSKLIGKGGKQIKNLKKQLNVSITIPKDEKVDKNDTLEQGKDLNDETNLIENEGINEELGTVEGVSKVIFRGEKKLCENAKSKIESMVEEWEHFITSEIHIPKAHHGAIRGYKSLVILKIQKRFKVDVRFAPLNEEQNDTIKITGIPENVEGAIKAINELATEIVYFVFIILF